MWIVANHQRTITLALQATPANADAYALGEWLRRQVTRPDDWRALSNGHPMRIWVADAARWREQLEIDFMSGRPGSFEKIADPASPRLETMQPGQCLVTDRTLADPRLSVVTRIDDFTIYRFKAGVQ